MRFHLIALLAAATVCCAGVRVSQDTISLPTWSEGPADPNPAFEYFALPASLYPVYPYTMRTNFLTDHPNQAWRILRLENEYLSCRFFPDLGGRLYSCLDKVSGKEMFYANPVIRKAYVGLRGAWVAMGIEINFPVGHSLVSVSPVSYATRQNDDGSASVWMGDIDRKTGLEWRVEFVLRPGSALLQQNNFMYNRGDIRQPYYWWSNAGIKIEDQNSTFLYPTHVVASHGFTVLDTWPKSTSGKDMSIVKNIPDQEAWFAHGTREPFMSIYHPATRTATIHYGDPNDMPGKKLWAWGAAWDPWVKTNLTDNFPSYMESQGGSAMNQETHDFLGPQQARRTTEYWTPARELDGVSRATLDAVLYMGRRTGASGQPELVLQVNATHAIPGASIRVLNGDNAVFSDTADLMPEVTYSRAVSGLADDAAYTFQLLDNAGNSLLAHTENRYDALNASDVTLGPQPQRDLSKSDTEDQVLFRADYDERLQQYVYAESDYSTGLQKFPQSTALLKASGRLAVAAARYDDAAAQLPQALASTADDPESHYYLGLAYFGQGQYGAAINEWSGIQSSPQFGRAATFALGCLHALMGDLADAAALFDNVNAQTQDSVRAAAMQIAVLRHLGQTDAAATKLGQWTAYSPTDLFLRFEQTLAGSADDALWQALGSEPERVLNLVDDYLRLGFYDDALTLLDRSYPDAPVLQREPGATAPQNNALIAYYRGYCRNRTGGSGAADFAAASTLPLAYIFPNRTSSFAVLREAIQTNPNDAAAHDLLGLLYMSRRLVNDAIAEWQIARSIRKDLPALHRNLGRSLLDIKKDPLAALPILKEGLAVEPSNPDLQDANKRAANAVPSSSTACTFMLPNSSTSVGAGPLSATVTFSASAPTCSWTAASYSSWITIASGRNGTGNGVITYAVSPNTSTAARSGTISATGQLFTIVQSGTACTYSVASSSASVAVDGGQVSTDVKTGAGCSWSASTGESWLSIASPLGMGNGTAIITAAPNTGADRTGVVTIAGQSFTVSQSGKPVSDAAAHRRRHD